jgi:bile acid-coenzyme A ligase
MSEIPLSSILRYHSQRLPDDALAVLDGNQAVTWRQLEARANQRARQLRAVDVGAGAYVTIALPNGIAFYEWTFAAWKCGATPNPIPAFLPRLNRRDVLETVRPAALIVDRSPSPDEWDGPTLRADADIDDVESTPIDEQVAPYWKAILSGGSTGQPKIIVDHQPATFDPEQPVRFQNPGGTLLNPGPLYHNAPFVCAHHALAIGCRVVDMPRFDPEKALALIEQYRADWVNFVPTMMHRIWRLPKEVRERYDLSSLKTVFHMASAMPAWLKQHWIDWLGPDRIWELYGGTERVGSTVISGREWLERPGSVGRAVAPSKVRILNASGEECAAGEIGEVFLVPVPGKERPYHYIGAETPRRPDGLETLGDLGHVDTEDYLFLADRRTDLITRGGANIYPAEVEAALDRHSDIQSSVVIGLPDDELGQVVHAIIQTRRSSEAGAFLAELAAYLENHLVTYKRPYTFEFQDHLLRDDAGKVRRSALRDERIAWLEAGRAFQTYPDQNRSASSAASAAAK